MSQRELTARDRAVLDFERAWSVDVGLASGEAGVRGGKRHAIREQLGLSPSRYYQLLAELTDLPAARRHDPLLVLRLRRGRRDRTGRRTVPLGLADQSRRGHTQ